ncbi:hypothetical protein H310_14025 [Aphanomyces invadans]|uniref:Uncharacterized protein n=1 Tax=Aphanomyces invadans TaxID=157072 RepID=A0A024TB19_9STRA|nr:hypothetical protein H310_14025 [Aphanomyces invadans]ETV91330.1 hypothetical protein H310_14025 [Aphanomyces invadans]|eukprot:XP_008879958.1 hypothetical protein H310_14025 [Aphanomyces invadans]
MATPLKRRAFNEREEILLLTQVSVKDRILHEEAASWKCGIQLCVILTHSTSSIDATSMVKVRKHDERIVLLDDLSSQVEVAKKEEADRADMREEAMKSQGKRKNREGDDEAAGGKMFKVLTLMNDANKCELELRKFMFEKELEDKKSVRCKPGNARPKLRNVKHNCNNSNYFSHP